MPWFVKKRAGFLKIRKWGVFFLSGLALSGCLYNPSSSDSDPDPVPNDPPILGVISFSPEIPKTTDDLSVNASGFDPDGNVISFFYRWMKNGVVIAGQTDSILNSSFFKKGDAIKVEVTLSDGIGSSSGELEVLIVDSAPVLSFSLPATVPYGVPSFFQISASDADNDPLSFYLNYGPSGMAVDPVSGEVVWTPSGPMFGEELMVNFSVGVSADGINTNFPGLVTVLDPGHPPPLARSGVEIPSFGGGIHIADFNGDLVPEIVLTDSSKLVYKMRFDGANYVQDWMYPFDLARDGRITTIQVADINGDDSPDILVGSWKQIIILDGKTGTKIGDIQDPYSLHFSIHVADLDNDTEDEIIFIGTDYIFSSQNTVNVYRTSDLTLKWKSDPLDIGFSLTVGNVDADLELEIVTSNGYVFGGSTFATQWIYPGGFGRQVDSGDLNNDGIDEIVGVYGGAKVFSAVSKVLLWEITEVGRGNGAVLVENIDSDPEAEIILGDDQWGNVAAYDGKTGAGIQKWIINSQNHGVSSMAAGDTDGDGKIEIVWASGSTSSGEDSLVVAGLNPDIGVEWTNTDPNQFDGPFSGASWAQTSAGHKQAIFATAGTNSGYSGTRVIGLDPADERLTWSPELGRNFSSYAPLITVDYDKDEIDEVFLGTSDFSNGYLTAYDYSSDSTEWLSPEYSSDKAVAVTSGDMNNDGKADLVAFTTGGYIRVFDVFGNTLLWTSPQFIGFGLRDIEVADLDNDGILEIIFSFWDTITVLEKSGAAYQVRSEVPFADVSGLTVGDVDNDGKPEIIAAASTAFFNSPSNILILDGETLSVNSVFPVWGAVYDISTTTPDKLPVNLVVGGVLRDGYYRELLRVIEPQLGNEIWRSPSLIGVTTPNSIGFVDTNHDGRVELILGTSDVMYITK